MDTYHKNRSLFVLENHYRILFLRQVTEELPFRVYSKELIELRFRQPYTKGRFLVDAGIVQRKTAVEYLKELEKIGILRVQKIGKEALYLNLGLYDLLSQ